MNRFKNWVAAGAFSLLVLGIPAVASAQYGGYDPYGRNNDPYGNRNGGYNNGQYGNVNGTVRSLKEKTRQFTRQLDRDLDNSRMNGSRREDEINRMADRFKDAVNNLDNNYYNNNRSYGRNDNEMRRVFDAASQIERSISRAQVSYQTRNLWSSIRNDLQSISRGYNTYNNGNNNGGWGNGRNNGNNGGVWGNSRGNRQGLPSWWPF
ncbi:MAG: hypothetical protein QM785_06130 [Pyrinomonadaceae bacterium]